MIQFALYIVLASCSLLVHGNISSKILKSAEIVNEINNLKYNTWKADTYGLTEIDINHFIKSRLGVKMTSPPPAAKVGSSVEDLEKSNIQPPPKGFLIKESTTLPTNFTWDNKTLTSCPIGKIRNQANCGSCWAVSSVSAFGDRLCIHSKGKFKTILSSNHVTACCSENYGCEGGYMDSVYRFFRITGTVTGGEYESDEGCQPYSIRPCGTNEYEFYCSTNYAWTPKCKNTTCTNPTYGHKHEKDVYKIISYHYVGSMWDEYSIRSEIYVNGPVTATFYVYPDFIFYKKGIYDHKVGMFPLGGHAVKVIGWGEENGVKYWTVANSWGENWGENGFFRIKRGVNMCSFERSIMGVVPDLEKHNSYVH